MMIRTVHIPAAVCLLLSWPCLADVNWSVGEPGTAMTENVYNTDAHRTIHWAEPGGFRIAVDDAAVYDNWRDVDDAPQVRIDLSINGLSLRNKDFVVTAKTTLFRYGDRYHAGLCVVFDTHDLLVWGPHGSTDPTVHHSTDLRLRRLDGVDEWQAYSDTEAFLKLKRRGNRYEAWYSADGVIWTRAATTDIEDPPLYVGAILKTWGSPRAEDVDFLHFQITHVENEPTFPSGAPAYEPNVEYGVGDAGHPPIDFIYDIHPNLEPIERDILLRLFIREGDVAGPSPNDRKLYMIHSQEGGSITTWERGLVPLQRVFDMLTDPNSHPTLRTLNLLGVAPRFPDGWGSLRAEQDWILIDIHEDFVRDRFPATREVAADGGIDRKFYLLGHSAGGQFTARFVMGHAAKLHRAVASSPGSMTFPTSRYEWMWGTALTDRFRDQNPRFSVNLDALFELPLAIVEGENDNLLDRAHDDPALGWQPPDFIFSVGYSRCDEAKKWVRQVAQRSDGLANVGLYLCPRWAHGFNGDKIEVSLLYLFGTEADRAGIEPWKYSFTLDAQDEEREISPAGVFPGVPYYFKFDRYSLPECTADRRYDFVAAGDQRRGRVSDGTLCVVRDAQGNLVGDGWGTYELTHNDTTLHVTVDGEEYVWPRMYYGKLRLYDRRMESFLEESSAATLRFLQERVIGRRLYFHTCNGRDASGPTADSSLSVAVEFTTSNTVVDADTGAPFADPDMMQTWDYDDVANRMTFVDGHGDPHDLHIGEWRWGVDQSGESFLAGLNTYEVHYMDRMEVQTGAIYNPRYFEEWDPTISDFDDDGVSDAFDNCPLVWDPTQCDIDEDGIGDVCDPSLPDLCPAFSIILITLTLVGLARFRPARSAPRPSRV